MKQLFISDLDGTLLRSHAVLSDFSRENLTTLLSEGFPFTIATARSIVSVREIMGDLPISLPVICGNGACVAELSTGKHYQTFGLQKGTDRGILDIILEHGQTCFAATYDGEAEHLYMGEVRNEAMAAYEKERLDAEDQRLRYVTELSQIVDEEVVCFNVIDREGPLKKLANDIRAAYGEELAMYYYENWYEEGWYWLSLYDKAANKGRAVAALAEQVGLSCEQVTVFGDNLNDSSMFKIAGKSVAPSNAVPSIHALATEIIDSNETDSVVKYLLKTTTQP
ncbi:MAG: HAD family hydrolase [Bacteroidota bacterium]